MDSFKASQSNLSAYWGRRGVIESTSTEGQNYVQSVERLLLHGLKLGLKVRNIRLTLVYVASLADSGLQGMLQKLPQKLSVYAVERAWIRFRLNSGTLGDCVSKIASTVPKTLYHDWAFMQSPEESGAFASMLREATQNVVFTMGLEDPPGFAVQTTIAHERASGGPETVHVQSQKRKKHKPKEGDKVHTVKVQKAAGSKPRARRVVIESESNEDDGKGHALKREGSLPHLLKKNSGGYIGKEDVPTPEGLPFDNPVAETDRTEQGRSVSIAIMHRRQTQTAGKSPTNNPFGDESGESGTLPRRQSLNPFESESSEHSYDKRRSMKSMGSVNENERTSISTNPFDDDNDDDTLAYKPHPGKDKRRSIKSDTGDDEAIQPSHSTNPFDDDNDDNGSTGGGYSSRSGSHYGSKRSSHIGNEDIHHKSFNPFEDDEVVEEAVETPSGIKKSLPTNPFADETSFSEGFSSVETSAASSVDRKIRVGKNMNRPISTDFSPKDYGAQTYAKYPTSTSFEEDSGSTKKVFEGGFSATNPFESAGSYSSEYLDKHESEHKSSAMSEAFNPFNDDDDNNEGAAAVASFSANEKEKEEESTNPFAFDAGDDDNNAKSVAVAVEPPASNSPRRLVKGIKDVAVLPSILSEIKKEEEEIRVMKEEEEERRRMEEKRMEEEEEEDIDSSLVFKMSIKDSLIIDDYDKRDTERTLYEIAKDRIARLNKGAKAGTGRGGEGATAAGYPSSGNFDDQQKGATAYTRRAPEEWVPNLVQINYYICDKSGPGISCFGCGATFGSLFSSAPRYCEFTGKYFCSKCHSNKKSVIPSHVVWDWDREQYPINNKSLKFLEDNSKVPLIYLTTINLSLYGQVTLLKSFRLVRKKLYFMKDFISSCTALGLKSQARVYFDTIPSYYYDSMDIYSLYDFVHLDEVIDKLTDVLEVWLGHINACFMCKNKGSYCEICGSNELIYPFKLGDVVQCPRCFGVFHKDCYKPESCPKCKRKVRDQLKK